MKRWYIDTISSEFTCSLLSMDAKSKSCTMKSDSGEVINVTFLTKDKFPFAVAKSGKLTDCKISVDKDKKLQNALIVFK